MKPRFLGYKGFVFRCGCGCVGVGRLLGLGGLGGIVGDSVRGWLGGQWFEGC